MMENTAIRRFSTKIRVRYSETDKMGFCYYGNYAQYFEVARVEALRELGIHTNKRLSTMMFLRYVRLFQN
jgi:acyl-CoA thioester hydrolase